LVAMMSKAQENRKRKREDEAKNDPRQTKLSFTKKRKVKLLNPPDVGKPPTPKKQSNISASKLSRKGQGLYSLAASDSSRAKPKPSLFSSAWTGVKNKARDLTSIISGKPKTLLPGPFFQRREAQRPEILVEALTTSVWPKKLLEEEKLRKELSSVQKLKQMQTLKRPPKTWMNNFQTWAMEEHPNFPDTKTWRYALCGRTPKGFTERFQDLPKEKVEKKERKESHSGCQENPISIESDGESGKQLIRRTGSKSKLQKPRKDSLSGPPPLEKQTTQCPLCQKYFSSRRIEGHASQCNGS